MWVIRQSGLSLEVLWSLFAPPASVMPAVADTDAALTLARGAVASLTVTWSILGPGHIFTPLHAFNVLTSRSLKWRRMTQIMFDGAGSMSALFIHLLVNGGHSRRSVSRESDASNTGLWGAWRSVCAPTREHVSSPASSLSDGALAVLWGLFWKGFLWGSLWVCGLLCD